MALYSTQDLDAAGDSLTKVFSRAKEHLYDPTFDGRVVDMLPTIWGHEQGLSTALARRSKYLFGLYTPSVERTVAQSWVDANYSNIEKDFQTDKGAQFYTKLPNPYRPYGTLPQGLMRIIKSEDTDSSSSNIQKSKKERMVDWIADQKHKPIDWSKVANPEAGSEMEVFFKEVRLEFLKSSGCTLFSHIIFDLIFTQISQYHAFVKDISRALLAGTVKGYVMNAFTVDILTEIFVCAFSWLVVRPLASYLPFALLLVTNAGLKTGLKSSVRVVVQKLYDGKPHYLNNARDPAIEFVKGLLKGGSRNLYVSFMGPAIYSLDTVFCPVFTVAFIAVMWIQTFV